MPFKVSPKAKAIINGDFIFQFHDGIHSKILTTLLEMFFRQMFFRHKDEYDRINELSYFKCSLASRINKLRDTAIELGSKYTFFKTWNSILNNNGSLNYSLIRWFFSSLKNLRVTLKDTKHLVIGYGKTLRLISLPNVKTEHLILNINF